MEAEWIFYIGVGLLALVGVGETLARVFNRIAAKKGVDNTNLDEIAGCLSLGTNTLRTIAAALGVEVKDEDSKEVAAAKVKTAVDAKKG